jgi:hypothetical protein
VIDIEYAGQHVFATACDSKMHPQEMRDAITSMCFVTVELPRPPLFSSFFGKLRKNDLIKTAEYDILLYKLYAFN